MEQWIEEFLFRGRPPSGPDSEKSPEFHVYVGRQVTDPFDPKAVQRRFVGPLSPKQAEKMGLSLESLVTGVNTEALNRVAELEAQLASLQGQTK